MSNKNKVAIAQEIENRKSYGDRCDGIMFNHTNGDYIAVNVFDRVPEDMLTDENWTIKDEAHVIFALNLTLHGDAKFSHVYNVIKDLNDDQLELFIDALYDAADSSGADLFEPVVRFGSDSY